MIHYDYSPRVLVISDRASIDVAAELTAMEAVGNALAQLRDQESRLRVIHWASERFQAMSRTHEPVAAGSPGPALTLDAPDELLTGLSTHVRAEPPHIIEDLPFDSLVQDFTADLMHFAIEWQRA